jgi:hypothetical protein
VKCACSGIFLVTILKKGELPYITTVRKTADEEGNLQCNSSQMSHLGPLALRTLRHSVLSGTFCCPLLSANLVLFHTYGPCCTLIIASVRCVYMYLLAQ